MDLYLAWIIKVMAVSVNTGGETLSSSSLCKRGVVAFSAEDPDSHGSRRENKFKKKGKISRKLEITASLFNF